MAEARNQGRAGSPRVTLPAVGFFKWLYRLPGRIDRSVEKTVIASSVVQGESMGATQLDPGAMNAALGEIEGSRSDAGDPADADGG
jgi:hypothetical protein